ncbi:hypothetical protein [Hymenobacter yonginensis]|uniref:STAS/SEC14 domain-containing protein n=1 Tax=Hymenobacter yonginensis TaxID=748197 RepID=A0ABY7PSV5_9BACT|nr:hypothetical protein [Hymenobacter yonginensis]WBO85990.1 hypothetical protein O9Z63_06985 [Hymenobacter yonginensis]
MPYSAHHPVYFENAVGRILEHPEGYAWVIYKDTRRGITEFRALLTHLGQLLLRRGWSRILVDMHLIQPLSEPEKQFLVDEWYSRKIARPEHVCVAYLAAQDAVSRLSIHQIQAEARKENTSDAFQTLAEAQAYLLTCPL